MRNLNQTARPPKLAALILACLLSLASPAFAGGWVSIGGGELFRDAHNPWFLKNVSRVEYCVKTAEASLSVSRDAARAATREGFAYWKREMAKAAASLDRTQFVLGEQDFVEVECPAANAPDSAWPDVRFLFGFESLSEKEAEFLKDPLRYIGVSVRTDYGDVAQPVSRQMRGKGFVFIASDLGSSAYHGGADATLVERAWSRPNLLKFAVLHELGHVFGLPHVGTGLMAETFLEQMLSRSLADAFSRAPIASFFQPDDELELCGQLTAVGRAKFGMRADESCARARRTSSLRWELAALRGRANGPREARVLGEIFLGAPELSDFHPSPAIVLQLPEGQTLFSPTETLFRSFMFGPRFVAFGAKGSWRPRNGAAQAVYSRTGPDFLLVQGTEGGKIEALFSYSSPLGLLLMRDPTP